MSLQPSFGGRLWSFAGLAPRVAPDRVRRRSLRLGRHIPYGVTEPAPSSDDVGAMRHKVSRSGRLVIGLVAATGEPHKGQ